MIRAVPEPFRIRRSASAACFAAASPNADLLFRTFTSTLSPCAALKLYRIFATSSVLSLAFISHRISSLHAFQVNRVLRISGAGDGNRTHVRSLGSLAEHTKNVRIGGILTFFGFLKWIPIGAEALSFG